MEPKRPRTSEKRRKYRSDGTSIWSRPTIDGPGVWVTCVKGKEKQTVGELYDLFESLADQIWPNNKSDLEPEGNLAEHPCDGAPRPIKEGKNDRDVELDLEAQVAKEIAGMKRPRREVNCRTDTSCVIFISCKPPVDPVKLVVTHIENVEKTGVLQTRYTMRLVPVSGICGANIPEIQALCRRTFGAFFAENRDGKHTYKIELRVRNHTTLSRPMIIQEIARCVPAEHTVDLENPEIFILVEVFKSVCGISIVKDYYRQQKFNVMEIANARNSQTILGDPEGARLGVTQ